MWLAASHGGVTSFPRRQCGGVEPTEQGGGPASAMAGNGDVFGAAGAAAARACDLLDRARDFVGIYAVKGGRFGEIARLAVGSGRISPAFLASGEAFVDAVAIRLVCDDENAVVGVGHRYGAERYKGDQGKNGFHNAPDRDCISDFGTPKTLKMINLGAGTDRLAKIVPDQALDGIPSGAPWCRHVRPPHRLWHSLRDY